MKAVKQINLNSTDEFQHALKGFMKNEGITNQSEGIRTAVKLAYAISARKKKTSDFKALLGIGLKSTLNSNPKFKDEDDLWS